MDKKIGENFCAILLAAGYGSRISALTERPKSLLEINGKSLIEHHFDKWIELGIRNVNLVLGYKAQEIIDVVKKYEDRLSINFLLNEDYRNYGNTFSLFLGIKDVGGKSSLIFDADLIYETAMLEKFLMDKNANQILIGPGKLSDIECAKALVDGNGFVRMTVDKRAVSDKELETYSFAGEAIGILKFSNEVTKDLSKECDKFLANNENINKNWEHLLNDFLPKEKIGTHFNDSGKWIEIDTPEDFEQATNLFRS